jgi:hypothetical protein
MKPWRRQRPTKGCCTSKEENKDQDGGGENKD